MTFDDFLDLCSKFSVVPVAKRLFSGGESALSVYERLNDPNEPSFLLESAEQGIWGRYSFIGVRSRGVLTEKAGSAVWQSERVATLAEPLASSPLDALEQLVACWRSAPSDYPLISGLVGFASWGLVHELENLPQAKASDYEIPMIYFNQFEQLVIVDHVRAELILVSVQFVDGSSEPRSLFEDAQASIAELEAKLKVPAATVLVEPQWPEPEIRLRTVPDDYIAQVEKAKEHVRAGDVFQVVISQRFDMTCRASDLGMYRALRAINPSPYMYLFRGKDATGTFSIVGASPEALVTVEHGSAIMHPIAGSRPRGRTAEQDEELAESLRADSKEQSEHLMLVDLARNDLLKVCEPDSLLVTEFMQIHRFSHVMHLVSTVTGKLKGWQGAVAALRATFPAGTLSGAPKPRALEIIHDLEPTSRGIFGGVIGYFDFQGNADLAITIRTAFLRDGLAYIQAGAGIVLDSVPQSEYAETQAKSAAVLRAVAAADAMQP